ncbi:hypothetical protein [Ponticoccus sp. LZ-14]|uniref:hypothetical protein n=1 Tax=Alexandriicola marinus TaxID=2081710 RepID=UPI0013E025A6
MLSKTIRNLTIILAMTTTGGMAMADFAKVEDVMASQGASGWRFDVTISHPDTGWDHYADGWEVVDAAGNRLGFRELLHPHVNEQPFTRSLSGVAIPAGTGQVFIRARCLVDGWAPELTPVALR